MMANERVGILLYTRSHFSSMHMQIVKEIRQGIHNFDQSQARNCICNVGGNEAFYVIRPHPPKHK